MSHITATGRGSRLCLSWRNCAYRSKQSIRPFLVTICNPPSEVHLAYTVRRSYAQNYYWRHQGKNPGRPVINPSFRLPPSIASGLAALRGVGRETFWPVTQSDQAVSKCDYYVNWRWTTQKGRQEVWEWTRWQVEQSRVIGCLLHIHLTHPIRYPCFLSCISSCWCRILSILGIIFREWASRDMRYNNNPAHNWSYRNEWTRSSSEVWFHILEPPCWDHLFEAAENRL